MVGYVTTLFFSLLPFADVPNAKLTGINLSATAESKADLIKPLVFETVTGAYLAENSFKNV